MIIQFVSVVGGVILGMLVWFIVKPIVWKLQKEVPVTLRKENDNVQGG